MRVVARLRHQRESVVIGRELVTARVLSRRKFTADAAENSGGSRDYRENAFDDRDDRIDVIGFRDVMKLDVTHFVAERARELIVRRHEIQETHIHMDPSALDGEGVDALVLDHRKSERDVAAHAILREFRTYLIHPRCDERVLDDDALRVDLLILARALSDFLAR